MRANADDRHTTYRFRSHEASGTIALGSDSVGSSIRQHFTRIEYVTRLDRLNPDPIRTWRTPFEFWLCFAVGCLGVALAIVGLLDNSADLVSLVSHVAALLLGCILLFTAYLMPREEWVTFTARDGACGVRYCRGGPDKSHFDAFTDALISRITRKSAQVTTADNNVGRAARSSATFAWRDEHRQSAMRV